MIPKSNFYALFAMAIGIVSGLPTFFTARAVAGIPRSGASSIRVSLYGVFTSSDPLCKTGFYETVALQKSPTAFDMVSAPSLGSGPAAIPIKCAVMIVGNRISTAWAAGNYTTSSSGLSDSVCNAGGTQDLTICGNAGSTPIVDWPDEIATAMNRVGLSMTTQCSASPTGSEIVAVFLSTYAACIGNTSLDVSVAACTSGGQPANNTFRAPTSDGDATRGIKIGTPGTSSTYTFVIDPDAIFGNAGGVCQNLGPPRFNFK